jgi:hypothetical protein
VSETVTVVLGGDPTLDDLATALSALKDMLRGLSSDASLPAMTWVIDALERSSASVTVRGTGAPQDVSAVADTYLAVARLIPERMPVPSRVAAAADRFIRLLDDVPDVRFETADDDVTIAKDFTQEVPAATVVPPPPAVHGAVEGRVQTLSSRGSLHFTLYDLRRDKAVSCYLTSSYEDTMRDAWGRIAVVEGTVKRDPRTGRPLTIRGVSRIEFPDEGHKGDWRQAEGALRGIGSDEPAESVIRRLRDAR